MFPGLLLPLTDQLHTAVRIYPDEKLTRVPDDESNTTPLSTKPPGIAPENQQVHRLRVTLTISPLVVYVIGWLRLIRLSVSLPSRGAATGKRIS